MPMTSAALLASAPPELPGWRAASVWMTSPSNRFPGAGRGHQAAAERAHDPCAHRALEAERVADGNDQLADPQPACIAEPGRLVAVAGRPDHRQVAQTVGAHDLEGGLVAGRKRGRPAVGALHDVGRRDQQPVGRDEHGRAGAGRAVHVVLDPERGHRWQELLGYPRHRARVTVQQRLRRHRWAPGRGAPGQARQRVRPPAHPR